MTTIKVHGGIDILRLPVNEEEHIFPPWQIKYTQSHILHSKCSKNEESCGQDPEPCQFCVYNRALEMPHMPDMVFPNNILYLKHQNGAKIQFNALDALKRVSNGKINIQLACAESWKESRADCKEYLEEKVKPFDWTFTTDYTGTMEDVTIEETKERIDMEKLKRKEKILFYHELTLFEDELHDNGIGSLSVKIRVMPGSLFILLRYFLRIDNVMLRINDTRLYHEFDKSYVLREYTSREAQVKDLHESPTLFIEPSHIAPYLPLIQSHYHKLILPRKTNPVVNEKKETINSTSDNSEATSSKISDDKAVNDSTT
ncbi:TIP41-like protein [Diachasmimorpha longicaudata]|uniref:TIP41-like protein n=1 Tax=Diachasmimorpha longicaudata TaxID=58733 RepID=UPI0030B90CAD